MTWRNGTRIERRITRVVAIPNMIVRATSDIRDTRCLRDIGYDLIPCSKHFTIEIVDDGRQPIVDAYTVLTRLGQKGVAKDTLVVGVLLDRLKRSFLEIGDLSFQRRRLNRLADCEIVQPSEQTFSRGLRIDFRLTQLTDREIGGPIAKLAEDVANVLSDIDELGQLHIMRDGAGIVGQLRGQIVDGASDHEYQCAGQK